MISQLTVFLENKEGRLASAVRSIARADINMQAMFLADTKDFGILRIFCDTPEKACRILQEEGYQARLIDVVAVKVPNVPGSLSKLFDYLDDKETIMVEKSDVAAVLELIRPSLQADGGDVALVDVSDDGVVTVELQGACKGCPMSQMTLANGVERILKERIPGVTKVVPAQ